MLIGKIDGKSVTKKLAITSGKIIIRPDRIVKLALLSVICGYRKSKKIEVSESFWTNSADLNSFLNFILNHKKFAPIKFNVEVDYPLSFSTKRLIKKRAGRYLVLGSGGIDSTGAIFHYLDNKIKPLVFFLHFGQINNNREEKIIKDICKRFDLDMVVARINIKKEVLMGWKEWNYIVPARNFLISSLGALVLKEIASSGKIVLATTQEEINHPNATPDKSKRFYAFCSELYSKEYGTGIQLITPFSNVTKSELLSVWRRKWLKKYNFSPYETSTCYKGIECGECNSCFKRSISLLAGGFGLDRTIKVNPFEFDIDKSIKYLKRAFSKRGNFTAKRRLYTIRGYIRASELGIIKSQRLKKEVASAGRKLNLSVNSKDYK